MSIPRKYLILLALMIAASIAAMVLRPTQRISDEGVKINLEAMIPKTFAGWTLVENASSQIVNPEQQAKLDSLYSQILSRAYVNAAGETIMLSIAYGEDQSDSKQLHYPEVCYPSQGFQITSSQKAELYTPHGNIRVLRLHAEMGTRSEPLTYWSTVGNKVVRGGKEIKQEQLRYGFKGKIPDGLLFRVSSIDSNANSGYQLQQSFVQALMADMNKGNRLRLAGL